MNTQLNTLVIKVGGALLESKQAAMAFFQQLLKLEQVNPVIVHGGGVQVQTLLAELGLTSEKRNGVRVTPDGHMPYVTGVLAGSANKQLVAIAQSVGCAAVGLSIVDGNMVNSQVLDPSLGSVGAPDTVNTALLDTLIHKHWMPIVASIGSDGNGNLLNVNADHAAAALASGLKCPLVLLSDVHAVLDAKRQRIDQIKPDNMAQLIADGVIRDGMQVKVESAMDTAKATGQAVTIASWKNDIQAIIAGQSGTQVLAEKG